MQGLRRGPFGAQSDSQTTTNRWTMNSREQAHHEDRTALRKLERRPWLVIALAVIGTIAASAFVYGIVNDHNTEQVRALTVQAQDAADRARGFAQADCQTWKTLADIRPSATSPVSGLQLYAGFRDSYHLKGCVDVSGELAAPDPRLLPYIKVR